MFSILSLPLINNQGSDASWRYRLSRWLVLDKRCNVNQHLLHFPDRP